MPGDELEDDHERQEDKDNDQEQKVWFAAHAVRSSWTSRNRVGVEPVRVARGRFVRTTFAIVSSRTKNGRRLIRTDVVLRTKEFKPASSNDQVVHPQQAHGLSPFPGFTVGVEHPMARIKSWVLLDPVGTDLTVISGVHFAVIALAAFFCTIWVWQVKGTQHRAQVQSKKLSQS